MAIYSKLLQVNYVNGVTTLSLSDGTPINSITFDDGQGHTEQLQIYNQPQDIPEGGSGITIANEAHTIYAPLVATDNPNATHLIVRGNDSVYAVANVTY